MGSKYNNHVELVQGVLQVEDESLTQGERLFLNVLAAHNVKELPHPGNDRLARGCGIKTRQGVNYVRDALIKKRLIEIVGNSRGGRGLAVTYRILTGDPRFPSPKPASNDLPVSDAKPASPDLPVSGETRKHNDRNPQVNPTKPASPDLHPNTSRIQAEELHESESRAKVALPEGIENQDWQDYLESRHAKMTQRSQELQLKRLNGLVRQGYDPKEILEDCIEFGRSIDKAVKKCEPRYPSDAELIQLYFNVRNRLIAEGESPEIIAAFDRETEQHLLEKHPARGEPLPTVWEAIQIRRGTANSTAAGLCDHGNAEGECNIPCCRNVPTLPGMGHGGMPRGKSKSDIEYPF